MKNIYEVYDEFEEATNKKEKMKVIEDNLNPTLVEVLKLTFHPGIQWLINERPDDYIIPDTLPGVSFGQLSTELRRLYLFQKCNPAAEQLSPEKRHQILLQFLETLEPREAEVVISIFKKDPGVSGLTYQFVKEAFPSMLP